MKVTAKANKLAVPLIALLIIISPALASLLIVRQQAINEELEQLFSFAEETAFLTREAAGQFFTAREILLAQFSDTPCSEAAIATMRQLNVTYEHLQLLGYLEGNRLVCSSFGLHPGGIDLGPEQGRGTFGSRLWLNRTLPFTGDSEFFITGERFAAVMSSQFAFRGNLEADMQAAVFAMGEAGPLMLASRGIVDQDMLSLPGNDSRRGFHRGDKLIAIYQPEERDLTVIVTASMDRVTGFVSGFASLFIPMSLLFGLAMLLFIRYLYAQRSSLKNELRIALRRNEFYLEYQPIVELQSGICTGAEALLRVNRNGEPVSPETFIPLAEKTGMITELTARVIELLEEDLRQTLKLHKTFHIGINLSSADINSTDTFQLISNLLKRTGLPPSNFVIEATESGLLNAEVARDAIRRIRSNGIKVAIDDFGTGYSSLSYLSSYELDYLKIDKSFVDAIGTGSVQSEVVSHIIQMAKSLNLQLIAEGVETERQAMLLKEKGVQYAQGWLFGKPMRAPEFMDYYTRQYGIKPASNFWKNLGREDREQES